MVRTFKSCISAAGTGLALASIAALAIPSVAQEATAQSVKPEQSAPVDASAGQIVVRDAASGQLRPATADEAHALREQHAKGKLRVAPQATLARYHYSGARGARLTDEFMNYSIVVRQPDGSLKEYCFQSREAAEAAIKSAPVGATATLPTE
ncbi:MAG TPA: hypothetical protein VIO33_14800 [Burkholderiaceae bacterium]